MAGLGSVVIQFLGKDKLSKTVKDITRDLVGMNKKTGESQSAISNFGRIAGGALFGIVGVAAGAAAAFADMAQEALADKQSADQLARTLKSLDGVTDDMVAANEDWISAMQLATNVADTDLRDAVSKLALATGDLTKAQDLTTLALDTSTASGRSLKSVTDALAKAENGNTAALKRMFPWLDKNHDGSVSLKEAVDGLKGAYGGAAKEAAKTKPWQTLMTIFGELKESVGSALIPVLEDFAEWFSKKKNQQAIQDFIKRVGDAATAVGEDLADALKDLVKWLKNKDNQKTISDFAESMRETASAIGAIVGAAKTVIGWLKTIYSWMDKINRLTDVFQFLPDSMQRSSAATAATSGPSVSAMRVAPAPTLTTPTPVVNVTEEQVYRAVARLVMRGDTRNGRRTRIA